MVRIKELREEKEILQRDLSKALNRTRACVSSWEQGKTEPSIEDLIKMADLFNVTVDYLVGRTDESEINDKNNQPQKSPDEIISELFGGLPDRQKWHTIGFVQALYKGDDFK